MIGFLNKPSWAGCAVWALPLFFSIPFASFAKLEQKDCTFQTVDHSSRMGPVRSQGKTGMCWAFVTAALLEEEFYKTRKANQSVDWALHSISPLDVSRCKWNLGFKLEHQGSFVKEGLACIAKPLSNTGGVCFEKDASFPNTEICGYTAKIPMDIQGETFEIDGKRVDLVCGIEALQKFYSAKETVCSKDLNNPKTCIDPILKGEPLVKEVILELKKDFNLKDQSNQALLSKLGLGDEKGLLDVLCKKAMSAKWAGNFYSSVYLNKCNSSNRVLSEINPDRIIALDLSRDPIKTEGEVPGKILKIRTILKTINRSMSADICLKPQEERKDDSAEEMLKEFNRSCPNKHAIVINGLKWENGECKIQIKNSWGTGTKLNGWLDAEALLKSVGEVTYLKNQAPELKGALE